eukprot:4838166-Amphidinium_carterae.1
MRALHASRCAILEAVATMSDAAIMRDRVPGCTVATVGVAGPAILGDTGKVVASRVEDDAEVGVMCFFPPKAGDPTRQSALLIVDKFAKPPPIGLLERLAQLQPATGSIAAPWDGHMPPDWSRWIIASDWAWGHSRMIERVEL